MNLIEKSKNSKYYAENKQRILDMYKEKINCPTCDKSVCRQNLLRHMSKGICQKNER